MKNRKAPVFLSGIVVVSIGAMAIFNANQTPADPNGEKQKHEEAVTEHVPTADERSAASNRALAALDKPQDDGDGHHKAMPISQNSGPSMEMATEPTILIKNYKAIPPVPNDSGTGAHWYDEESRAHKIADENAKSRG